VRAKYIFLILSGICAVAGFTAGDSPYLELGRPLAAILFGLFLITMVFEKESDLYDEQLGIKSRPLKSSENSGREVTENPNLAHAPT
jgi:hypothetical protein